MHNDIAKLHMSWSVEDSVEVNALATLNTAKESNETREDGQTWKEGHEKMHSGRQQAEVWEGESVFKNCIGSKAW